MTLCNIIKIEDKLMYVCDNCEQKVRCVRKIPEGEGLVVKGKWLCDLCYWGKDDKDHIKRLKETKKYNNHTNNKTFVCYNCGIEKDIKFFYQNKDKGYFIKRCKSCLSKILKDKYNKQKRHDIYLEIRKNTKNNCQYCGKQNISIKAKMCSRCYTHKRKNREIAVGTPFLSAEKHPSWKGGLIGIRDSIENLKEYKNIRNIIFKRDDWTCLFCKKRGGYLEFHHLKKMSDILMENNIKTQEDALKCKDLWDTNNGITLCNNCHRELHFGKAVKNQGSCIDTKKV